MNVILETAPTIEPILSDTREPKRRRQSGIYQIRCKPTGKVYVGSAVNLSARKSQHFSDLSLRKHRNSRLQNAWNKYGKEAFNFSVLELCNKENLINREQYHLDRIWELNREHRFNIVPTAGSNLGMFHSLEVRAKISKAKSGVSLNFTQEQIEKYRQNMIGNTLALGHRHTEECKAIIGEASKNQIFTKERKIKISQALKGNKNCLGHKCSEETKGKISIANKGNKSRSGQPHTEETKAKLSEAHMGKTHSEEHTNNMAYARAALSDRQCEIIRNIYQSGATTYTLLAKQFNCSHSTISNVVNHIGRAYQ
uniref:GIY-YIG domain-containing protein n=1 Tax=viral metagenome TaxID=1070528 RepID=A0A6H1ZD43_9ZZZZ